MVLIRRIKTIQTRFYCFYSVIDLYIARPLALIAQCTIIHAYSLNSILFNSIQFLLIVPSFGLFSTAFKIMKLRIDVSVQ